MYECNWCVTQSLLQTPVLSLFCLGFFFHLLLSVWFLFTSLFIFFKQDLRKEASTVSRWLPWLWMGQAPPPTGTQRKHPKTIWMVNTSLSKAVLSQSLLAEGCHCRCHPGWDARGQNTHQQMVFLYSWVQCALGCVSLSSPGPRSRKPL